ncbi:MAG: hypothetical protein N3F66_11065 [Spirochaetes bacterium]|nr:hypothetical protein [Spirochaetota bacterium]
MKLQKEIEYIQLTIIQKQAEIKKFKELNRADSLDNLLVRESINAGYIPQGAKAFEFKDTRFHNQQVQSLMPTRSEKFALYIKYGRILWLTFSLLIIIGMLLYYKHKNRL